MRSSSDLSHRPGSETDWRPRSCWIINDGKAGIENQCLGLAEALGLDPIVKRVRLRSPWRQLSPYFRLGNRFACAGGGDPLDPPWPDLVIGSGRQSIAPVLAIRQAARGRVPVLQIQDPGIGARHFDLLVVPEHDRLRGPNVLVMRGAPHRVTAERLAAALALHHDRLALLPRPRVAVLIGGSNGIYRVTPRVIGDLAGQLAALSRDVGAGLMVTASRRTGPENEAALRASLAGLPAEIWDGQGDNPYFAYLAMADAIIVTCESVSMASEACSTGKPVLVAPLEVVGNPRKFEAFHRALAEAGMTRPFTGKLESWSYAPLDDTRQIAQEVSRRLASRHASRL